MAKKKTNEEFIKQVYDLVGDEYTFLEEYINSSTKIKVRHNCEKCDNYEYMVKPSNFLDNGNRCPKCTLGIRGPKQFKKDFYKIAKDEYILLNEFVDSKTKIKVRHNSEKCNNYEWELKPYDFLSGIKCPMCQKLKITKTNNEFIKEVYDLVGNEYTFLEEYINNKTKIKIRHNCEKCNNYEYEISPNGFLAGNRCPKCFELNKRNNDSFKKEVYDLVGDEYTFLEEYKGNKIKIKVQHNCKDCNNHNYEIRPESFLRGNRCPECFGKKKGTTESFKKEVYELVKDEYSVIGEYEKNLVKIKMRHNICNSEWEITPNNFKRGKRCPKCASSKGEQAIKNYLNNISFKFQQEFTFCDCKDINLLPFDFAIFKDENLLGIIEFDGEQHFKKCNFFRGENGFKEIIFHDKIKTTYCEKNNIPLLRIKYTQINKIEEVLENFLKDTNKYKNNHFYKLSKEEYYKELKNTNLI